MSGREELARGLVEALLAQQAKDLHDAPLVWVESVDAVKVDGWVNANELADAILASDWLAAHDAETKAAAVEAATERLVLRDQFSERTLRLLDELAAQYRHTETPVAPE